MKAARSMVFLLALVGAAACHKPAEAELLPRPAAVAVARFVVSVRPMPQTLALSGTLLANQQAEVAANVSGRVLKTFIERGTEVQAGAPLVQVDVRAATFGEQEARANLLSAQSQQELAAAQCARNQALVDKGAISKEEWERISGQCRTTQRSAEAAQARALSALKNLADATVRAPFSGTVMERSVTAGEYVQPSSKVVTLVQSSPLRLQLTVSEADVGSIAVGQQVNFKVQAFAEQSFMSSIAYVGPALRGSTRDLVVEARVAPVKEPLRPGMFATAQLQLPDRDALAVPEKALRRASEKVTLFAVVGDHLEERVVQTGNARADFVAILDGLQAGESIAETASDALKDGQLVI
jgi:membrane fusion protein (multidrug efflux system)